MALDRWIALVDGPPLAAIHAAQPSLAVNFSENPIGSGNIGCYEYFAGCGKAR